MSKIINKKQLDFLIESTVKEYSYQSDPHGQSAGMSEWCSDQYNYDHPDCVSWRQQVGENEEKCRECGHKMNEEGLCESGCGSMDYMEEGEESIKNPGKYMGKAKQKAGVDDDGDGVPNGADKDPKDGDVTEASVKDLAESVTKTFNPSFLTENMDNFKKLINYRNK